MDTDEIILDYARHLYRRRGDAAFEMAREMIVHLQSIRDFERASNWRRIIVEMEKLRDGTQIGRRRATDQVPEA